MSSLRLALKQSLQESGLVSSSSERKKKKKARLKMYAVSTSDDNGDEDKIDITDNRSARKKTKKKGSDGYGGLNEDNNSCSSEENEFSPPEAEEGDFDNDSENSEGVEENDSSNDADENESRESSSSLRRRLHHRKSPEPQHDEHRKKQHSAAHKIQSRWKQKQESMPPEDDYDDDDLPEEDSSRGVKGSRKNQSQSLSSADNAVEDRMKSGSKARLSKNGSKKGRASKAKTVSPPDPSIIDWMNEIGVKRCRRSIVPGMRVKVRFATKVLVRRKNNSLDDPEQASIKKEVVRKKKWFGGRVSAVSKEGSKIRIKYDDGTSEVTKFPDKDIVVDDADNGEHQVPVDGFRPPPQSPRSPPIGTKSKSLTTGMMDADCSDLIDTPMQRTHSTIDLNAPVPKIVLQRSSDTEQNLVNDDNMPTSHPSTSQVIEQTSEIFTGLDEDLPSESIDDRKGFSIEEVNNAETQSAENEINNIISQTLENQPRMELTIDMKDQAFLASDIVETSLPPDHTSTDNRIQVYGTNTFIASSSSFQHDDASFDNSDIASQTKRKRGRPPKQRDTQSADVSPVSDPVQSASDVGTVGIAAVLSKIDDAVISPRLKSFEPSKPSLKIRITAMRSDGEKSPRNPKSATEDQGNDQHVKRSVKRKKKREANDIDSDRHLIKKLHIHIPSQQLALDDSNETQQTHDVHSFINALDLASDYPKKRKIVVDSATSLVSPALSPHQRKKRKKLDVAVSSEEAKGEPLFGGAPELSVDNASSKAMRIKKPPTLPSSASDKVVSNLKNSIFDSQTSFGDNSIESRPSTPSIIVHKDTLGTPIVRSGRRAAQQANERIASKHDVANNGAKKKKKNKDGDVVDSTTTLDLLEDSQWVQCDKCKKWRVIPSSVVDTLPNQWFCSDNIYDLKRANCDAPEQSDKQVAKERKRKLKKQQRLLMHKTDIVETTDAVVSSCAAKDHDSNERNQELKEIDKEPLPQGKENGVETSESPEPPPRDDDASALKSLNRMSPVENLLQSESGSDTQQNSKHERRISVTGAKKVKTIVERDCDKDKNVVVDSTAENVPRRRGRPRRTQYKEAPQSSGNVCKIEGNKLEDDNLEWVQCEKCDKWRRLPSHIAADDLPDLWYCEMNTWNPESASCDVPEDKADGMQDIGGFGGTGSLGIGKLTYRNLIFGSTGRKLNRPVSEKARAAESLFSIHQDEDAQPSRVLYADSCAFVCRSRPQLLSEENEKMTILERMSHSALWNDLRNAANVSYNDLRFLGQHDKARRLACFTFDTLPPDAVKPMKEMVIYFLADLTLSGEELYLKGQTAVVNELCSDFENARQFWTSNVVITTVAELVKDGVVECVQKKKLGMKSNECNDFYCPYYRRTAQSCNRSLVSAESTETVLGYKEGSALGKCSMTSGGSMSRSASRCMKISKPWKNRG